MHRPAAALAFAMFAALPLAAQDSRLAGRLDQPVLARVTFVVDSVRSAGLPTEPLVDKALEGASKRASGDRILAAMRALAGDLGSARAALGRGAGEPELVAGAAAIRAGATRGDLSRLRSEREGPLTVPLAVLANLMARGVPSDTAASVVQRLAASGAPDEAFTDLQAEIERDIGAGASPAAAAAVRGNPKGASTAGSSGAASPGRGNAGNAGAGGSANPGRGNPGNPGAGKPANPGNQGGGARPGNSGNNPGRGNPGTAAPNPGRGGGPPQASPGRGRGQPQSPPQTPRQPGNPKPK